MCANGIDAPKTHDIGLICLKCAEIDRSFSECQNECEQLEIYATRTRYPGRAVVEDSDAKSALQQALKIYKLVLEKLGQI